jgi:endonuclease/exonuclease/phosphatase family metal-dependent hydrolase
LNPIGSLEWEWIQTQSRVRVLARGRRTAVTEINSHEYYSVLAFQRPQHIRLLIGVAHIISRVRHEFDDVDEEITALADSIRDAEVQVGHTNTLLLGDLNANPFARGVVTARGLHAVMPRAVATQGGRQVMHRVYSYFFNPMWKFFGDGTASPPGTCYYAPEGSHRAFHWNMSDQVLIRPSLLPYYANDSVQIVHTLGTDSLTKANWIPNRDVGSDHLPVRIRLSC